MGDKVSLEEAIRLVGEAIREDDRTSAEHLANTLWDEAIGGNMRAAKMVLEYNVGRPLLADGAVADEREIPEALMEALNRAYGGPSVDDNEIFQFDKDGNLICDDPGD